MTTLTRYLLLRTGSRVIILLGIFLVLIAGGQIGAVVGRGVPVTTVWPAVPSILMMALPIAIPLAVTAGILVSLGAMHRDGEFRALASSGLRSVDVIARLWPLVLVTVLATTALTHLVMPAAMRGMRANQERYIQAALAHNVNSGRALYSEANGNAYALQAAGDRLDHVFLARRDGEASISLYARGAHWSLAAGESGDALALELDGVCVLRREADGTSSLALMPTVQFPYEKDPAQRRRIDPPDTWSTATLFTSIRAFDAGAGGTLADYNNAKLALHLRFFIPLSILAFVTFAAGLSLRRAGQEPLLGVLVIMVAVTLSTSPAVFYVKNALDHPQASPGWFLWPQTLVFGGLGLWWLFHPDLAANDRGPQPNLFARILQRLQQRASEGVDAAEAAQPDLLRSRGSWPSTLVRLILGKGVVTWILVLTMGTFLVVVGQVMSRIGVYVRAIDGKLGLAGEMLLYSIPEFVSLWLPLSVGAATLLLAAPLQRRGNLMVLTASGIPLRRVFAPMLAVACCACVGKFILDDRLLPVVQPHADGLDEELRRNESKRRGPQAAGWIAGEAFWMAADADTAQGRFTTVSAFLPGKGRAAGLIADRLVWEAGDWRLEGVEALDTGGQRRYLASGTLADLGWPPLQSLSQLRLDLLPDRIKTSNQLIAASSPLTKGIISSRLLNAATPLFCLLLCLPAFVRFENRHRLASALAGSAVLLALPVGIVALANRSLLSQQGDPILTAAIIAGGLLIVGGWRWLRMAP